MVKGLKESVRGLWSGDADLNDGTLATLRLKYDQLLKAPANLGLGTIPSIENDLNAALQELDNDLSFIHSGKCTYIHVHTVIVGPDKPAIPGQWLGSLHSVTGSNIHMYMNNIVLTRYFTRVLCSVL